MTTCMEPTREGACVLRSAVAALARSARANGASQRSVERATEVTYARFSRENIETPLSSRLAARVRAYYAGVLRREVCRNPSAADACYRSLLRVASAAQDLRDVGMSDARVRDELVETLGMDEGIVEAYLTRSGNVSVTDMTMSRSR